MVLYWGWLSLRYGGTCLPTIANPLFPNGGWIGESKAAVMRLLGPFARGYFANWMLAPGMTDSDTVSNRADETLKLAEIGGLKLPLVAKPDMGCRGAGVRVIRTPMDLETYYQNYPRNEPFILQSLVDQEGEAGVFYVRRPSQPRGRIISLTLKYFPYVTGDGRSTLQELIERDPRAGPRKHIYLPRHAHQLDRVLSDGEPFRIAFAGSHSRGAIFRDGAQFITEAMTDTFDAIAKDIQEFYFGRFDVRFSDIEDLQRGHGFTIVEVNGAGAESTHIWDRKTTLWTAYRTLMAQYKTMWEIGRDNLRRGYEPMKLGDLLAANRREGELVTRYPITE